MKIEIIRLIDGSKEQRIHVTHIAGLRLIRIRDFVRLGLETRSRVYDHIASGDLKVYNPNGTIKQSSRNTQAYICMGEWERIYDSASKDRAPLHITIKPRATAMRSPRA
jgi:hypothetical protein